ncbi:uncharacterized protein TM35_000271360 [Trypanosoma theileri]|uniref:Uncharacterized protein n=1 Tax=Trypanosoma theileri TaxID=67003 RepID=A0A1X0NPA7_9TRYP|nr:uncharacterized protein TM35_000271360 [Trypanosoma theileri]ORC86546.1 hypothetical protein TM35_000271360 [Trypanosoma theileri]
MKRPSPAQWRAPSAVATASWRYAPLGRPREIATTMWQGRWRPHGGHRFDTGKGGWGGANLRRNASPRILFYPFCLASDASAGGFASLLLAALPCLGEGAENRKFILPVGKEKWQGYGAQILLDGISLFLIVAKVVQQFCFR